MAACLNEAAITNARPAPGGEIDFGDQAIGPAQMTAFNTAEYVCTARYSLDPKYTTDWTAPQIGLVYDYYNQALAPCLNAHGYSIPPAPNRADFISDFHTAGGKWNPYSEITPPQPLNLQEELYSTCPPRPLSLDMYGPP